MKKLLPLLLLILIGCSEPEPINTDKLRFQNGIYFTKENNIEYSGPVFSTTIYDRVYLEGKLKNGKRVGPHIFSNNKGDRKEGYFYDINSIPQNFSGFVFSGVSYTNEMKEKSWGPQLFFYTVKDGILNGEFLSSDDYNTTLSGNYKNGLKEGKYIQIKSGYWVEREIGTFVNDVKQGEYVFTVSSIYHPPRFERNKYSGETKVSKTSHTKEKGFFVNGTKDGEYKIIGTYCGVKSSLFCFGSYFSDCENKTDIVIESGIYFQGEKKIQDTIFKEKVTIINNLDVLSDKKDPLKEKSEMIKKNLEKNSSEN